MNLKTLAIFLVFGFSLSLAQAAEAASGNCTVLDRLQVVGSGSTVQKEDKFAFSLFDKESLKRANTLGTCLMVSSSSAFKDKYALKYVSNGNTYVLVAGDIKEFVPSLRIKESNDSQTL